MPVFVHGYLVFTPVSLQHGFHRLHFLDPTSSLIYLFASAQEFNPIKQDTKNGKLREYKYGDMLFNYGAFPQTCAPPQPRGACGERERAAHACAARPRAFEECPPVAAGGHT
eukprot:1255681-Pleurochrysis_carterae.AAC.1